MPLLTPRRIGLVSIVVIAVVGAYVAFRPSSQTSTGAEQSPVALLHVMPNPAGVLPGSAVASPSEVETYRKTQIALVKSEFVANAALRDPKARDLESVRQQPDAATWLAGQIRVEYREGSAVLRVGVAGVPPKDAAVLTNAVAGAYLSAAVERDIRLQRERLEKLEDARSQLTRTLDTRKQELNLLASGAAVPPNATDHRALIAALYQERAGLRVELAKARVEKDACPEPGAREKLLREELNTLDARIKACEQADLDTVRAEVARLEAAVSSIASEYTRVQLDMNAPPRVSLLTGASVPSN